MDAFCSFSPGHGPWAKHVNDTNKLQVALVPPHLLPICFRTSWRWIPQLRNVSPPLTPKNNQFSQQKIKKKLPKCHKSCSKKKQGNQKNNSNPWGKQQTTPTRLQHRHTSWSRFKKSNKEGGKASIKRPKSSWSESHRHVFTFFWRLRSRT